MVNIKLQQRHHHNSREASGRLCENSASLCSPSGILPVITLDLYVAFQYLSWGFISPYLLSQFSSVLLQFYVLFTNHVSLWNRFVSVDDNVVVLRLSCQIVSLCSSFLLYRYVHLTCSLWFLLWRTWMTSNVTTGNMSLRDGTVWTGVCDLPGRSLAAALCEKGVEVLVESEQQQDEAWPSSSSSSSWSQAEPLQVGGRLGFDACYRASCCSWFLWSMKDSQCVFGLTNWFILCVQYDKKGAPERGWNNNWCLYLDDVAASSCFYVISVLH